MSIWGNRALFAFLLLLSSGCVSQVSPTYPVSAITTTATSPTPTVIPTVTPQPTATLPPSQLRIEIGEGVTDEDVETILSGVEMARRFLLKTVGSDIDEDKRTRIIIEIIADENAGPCCGGDMMNDVRLVFNTKVGWQIGSSPIWTQSNHQLNAGAHEYAHTWQWSLGCLRTTYAPFAWWLSEGIAEYVSINSQMSAGVISEQGYFDILADKNMTSFSVPLASMAPNGGNTWPGDIGFVATNYLVKIAPNKVLSLKEVCERTAAGTSFETAFKKAFGISLSEFNEFFDANRTNIVDLIQK